MIASSGSSRMRRLTLLIGMLLHLAGVAAIPFHVWSPAQPASETSIAERHDDGSSLPAHDELHCVICHAAGTLALPEQGAQLLLPEPVRRSETPSDHTARTHRPASRARARAPPLA